MYVIDLLFLWQLSHLKYPFHNDFPCFLLAFSNCTFETDATSCIWPQSSKSLNTFVTLFTSVMSLRLMGLLSWKKLNTCLNVWVGCPIMYICLMTAKTVESLWLGDPGEQTFPFLLQLRREQWFLGDFLFLPFACLHNFGKVCISFDMHSLPPPQFCWIGFLFLFSLFNNLFLNSCYSTAIGCSDIKNITETQQLNFKVQDIISVSVERSRKLIYQDY